MAAKIVDLGTERCDSLSKFRRLASGRAARIRPAQTPEVGIFINSPGGIGGGGGGGGCAIAVSVSDEEGPLKLNQQRDCVFYQLKIIGKEQVAANQREIQQGCHVMSFGAEALCFGYAARIAKHGQQRKDTSPK